MEISPKSKDHYFYDKSSQYRKFASECISSLERILKPKEVLKLRSKLQLDQEKFIEAQFIQIACEVSAATYFLEKFPVGFKYEKSMSGKKDVDFSFQTENKIFNVEVKCFNPPLISSEDEKNPEVRIMGPHLGGDLYQHLSSDLPNFRFTRNRLLSLNEFLKNANEKFIIRDGELNVLMIFCYGLDDFYDISQCLGGAFGIAFNRNADFPIESDRNIDISLYKNIDFIVFSNLAHLHFTHRGSNEIDHWNYKNSLVFGSQIHKEHELMGNDDLGFKIKKTFNLWNDDFISYEKNNLGNRVDFVFFKSYIDNLDAKGHMPARFWL